MGCDIHLSVEGRKGGRWNYLGESQFYDGRNYTIFAVLADVRNYDGIQPISSPRGTPTDATSEHLDKVEGMGGDGHSHSWLSFEELEEYDWENPSHSRNGIVALDTFIKWRDFKVPPRTYCRGVCGKDVALVSESDIEGMSEAQIRNSYPDKSVYVQCTWTEALNLSCGEFMGTIKKLKALRADYEAIRIVFFFDN